MVGVGDRIRNGRGVVSGLVGVLVANLITWASGSPLWYYSFLVDALVFLLAVVSFRVLSRTKGRQVSEKSFNEGVLWILGVILGALLTVGVSTLQTGIILGGVDLIWSIVLFAAIAGAAYGIIILQAALKPSPPPSGNQHPEI